MKVSIEREVGNLTVRFEGLAVVVSAIAIYQSMG